jgi:hypothetical protein
MKKIMTLAIIALASVAMVACGGQQKPAAAEECNKECTECPKAAECPEAQPAAEAAPAAEAPAETPAPEAAPAK